MSPENLHEEVPAQPRVAPVDAVPIGSRVPAAGPVRKEQVAAFKFGGSSLLGAERMLHAATLVRAASCVSSVVAVVSAMKGVTDQLLAVANALAEGKVVRARREAELIINLHLNVLQDLELAED